MKKITRLKDIATKLNVSVITVSKAIKGHPDISKERKKQILKAVKDLEYIPDAMLLV